MNNDSTIVIVIAVVVVGVCFACTGAREEPWQSDAGSQTDGASTEKPLIVIKDVSPHVVTGGASVTIRFGANQPLVSCWATVGGLVATCAEPQNGSECACSFVVGASTPEGTVGVQASGTNANGTGVANGKLQVDRTPPQADGNLAAIVRRPVGSNDAVSGGAGTASDDGGDLYPERQVTAVRVWDAESGGNVVLTVTAPDLLADGSFGAVELPGTGELAPRQLWLSTLDAAGNESARVEIVTGRDLDSPTGDGNLMTIVRRDLTQQDGVQGNAGAFDDAVSALKVVRVYDAESGGDLLGSVAPRADGSFPELLFGTMTSSYGRLWAEAEDKCGGTTKTEVLLGTDVAGPTVTGALLTFFARLAPAVDGVVAAPGAFADDVSAIKEVRVFDSATALVPVIPSFLPDASGGFPEKAVGDTGQDRVFFEAVDKAGNVSTRTYSRKVEATYNLAGKVRHKTNPSPLAMYGLAADGDPLASWPGLAPSQVDEFEDTANAAASAVDGSKNSTVGGTSTETALATWTDRTPPGTLPPSAGVHQAMVYDSARGKVIMLFGAPTSGYDPVQGPWEWDGTLGTWTDRTPAGTKPLARWGHAMVYDEERQRVVVFGGSYYDGSSRYLADTWEWDGAAGIWIERTPAGVKPGARSRHAMAYDSTRRKVVLFGGTDGSNNMNHTWEWDGALGTWTDRTPGAAKPSARSGHAMVYDSAQKKVFLFGGYDGSYRQDTWEWDGELGTWIERTPAGTKPLGSSGHAVVYDSTRGKVLQFGGSYYDGSHSYAQYLDADTWEWDGATGTWRLWIPENAKPESRGGHAMAFDSARTKVVMFGGGLQNTAYQELWELDVASATWASRETEVSPTARRELAMAYDGERRKVVLFGGHHFQTDFLADMWDWEGASRTWTKRFPSVTWPSARGGHAMAFDAFRNKVLLFGGLNDSSSHYLSDMWEWDGASESWTERIPPGVKPPTRWAHSLAFDAARGKAVLFGGYRGEDASGDVLADTWEWDGRAGTWSERTSAGAKPSRREFHAMAYDAARGKTVLFGGNTGAGRFQDTWEWDGVLGNWTERVVSGVKPTARAVHVMTYDPASRRVLLFGGIDGTGQKRDTWEWDGMSGIWVERVPAGETPGEGFGHAMAYDTAAGKSVLFGGNLYVPRETWEFSGAVVPHSRHAVHTAVVQLDDGSTASSISAKWVGAGAGEDPANPGVSTPGAQFYVWDWAAGAWELLGSHGLPVASCDEPAGSACTVDGVPSGDPGNYLRSGRIWLMAVPVFSSSAPPGTAVESAIHTDYIEARVSYTLP
ncbi:MAG: hypothetical protein HY897_12945 [Deltaproteobacteria bacterium]|nr:hypothetical protein [Deltaproteobacteria bacterium]